MYTDTTLMDPIEHINQIIESLRHLQEELEELKLELTGSTPPKFDPNAMDVMSHMRDIADSFKGGLKTKTP